MPQLDENKFAEIDVPLCHWCGEPLDGAGENGMHGPCANECSEATREALANDDCGEYA
jgi:hypothetical protein